MSIKKQLPIVEFGEFLERRGACKAENSVCIVCMNCMEANQELRELCNCSHMFHRECLDAWIDQGQVTCPLCRSKLLPEKGEELRKGEDPWRMERMVYLFGEDYLMAENRPSPLLVPVPVNFTTVSIKKQLPVVEFGKFLDRRGAQRAENSVCIVCMNCMEASHEIRKLCNCSHVFHRECLDAWIDQGQVACPLCRSKLLPERREEDKQGKDPWRMERMVYLFGEDYVIGTC
ncbi:hypothetical protein L1049_021065 [Liquidambar formosana]|uniref:RING-type domain-containing protein n=1 Tax=Liquidambar formosana TaxID=63359 RepID=A0AAP0X6M7_LIQFO